MIITLERKIFEKDYTIGDLFINGEFFSNTLEDSNRDIDKDGKFSNGEKKIPSKTCIPFGEYKIIVTMSPRFKRELPRLLDVPEFEGILIHRGNTHKDTSGCILIGEYKGNGVLVNSSIYEKNLINIMKEALSKDENITIRII